MNYPSIILAILGLAAAGGAATAWWRRSEGMNTINLLKTNIASYETTEKQNAVQIEALKASIVSQENTIKELRATIRTMVKEFKEYKNGRN